MIEKEFRNEDPSGKIIAFMLLIVSLIGGGAFAVKLGLQGIPPHKNGILSLYIRDCLYRRIRILLRNVNADAL